MKYRLFLQAALIGVLSGGGVVVRALGTVPALVVTHYSHGMADQWAPREILWAVAS